VGPARPSERRPTIDEGQIRIHFPGWVTCFHDAQRRVSMPTRGYAA
jgi:hypothetical protein